MQRVELRKQQKHERDTIEAPREMRSKLRQVAMDKHNFFMRNSTKGNYSILAQSTHPSKKKKVFELAHKRKEYEKQLKAKMDKKIIKLRRKERKCKTIPKKEEVSILFDKDINGEIKGDEKVFAFGSSMLVGQRKARPEGQEEKNKREYRKFQNRKLMGKKYLQDLKRNREIIQKEIVLGPRNTEILEEGTLEGKEDKLDDQEKMLDSARTMIKEGDLQISKMDQVNKKPKTFVILEKSTRRKTKKKIKEEEKENQSHKKHVNYLKTIKIGMNTLTLFNPKHGSTTHWIWNLNSKAK
jgi:hypothetical protein